ncbi:MAG: tRNA uridine-5-carboxymethylaminomethyl(34) synthesis GTPase MnmE, partial [Chloroflexi bacterium]|nr:tRNA uridine-5-carboxymethylaminomethyl(34) synthesis GTPase MnmE [Chloroflexota bacterium]
ARLAQPGEFTLRAFLNGRLDLAQAEAVADLVSAKTQAALRLASRQLEGHLSRRVGALRAGLLEVLAYLEATIDFPEEDIPRRDVLPDLVCAREELAVLLREAERGMIYRQGVRAAIVGRPNVGKSSLLNALLRADRAIVTEIPGTTRDTLEETMDLQGIPLVLVDTAGIGETADVVERLGIERSRRSLQTADLVLVVVDGSVPPCAEDVAVAGLAAGRPALVVVNKSDLEQAADYTDLLPAAPHLHVSALTGAGLSALEEAMAQMVLSGQVVTDGESGAGPAFAGNPRHRLLFQRARDHLQEAIAACEGGLPEDLVSIDVAAAVQALGEVTGETASADLLETIFSRFCIGK